MTHCSYVFLPLSNVVTVYCIAIKLFFGKLDLAGNLNLRFLPKTLDFKNYLPAVLYFQKREKMEIAILPRKKFPSHSKASSPAPKKKT